MQARYWHIIDQQMLQGSILVRSATSVSRRNIILKTIVLPSIKRTKLRGTFAVNVIKALTANYNQRFMRCSMSRNSDAKYDLFTSQGSYEKLASETLKLQIYCIMRYKEKRACNKHERNHENQNNSIANSTYVNWALEFKKKFDSNNQ
ncbi:UNKNOWN [Stylonychia lemnae]|uniref:Uncharacterized protein n=1 Tax=Stylonychia lemnae TaxID=5949 RepID=A0A078AUC3_STYLE|nr:UNKNOWN [Stylonychia lemnae]|eukprot:CDW85601.1 UNKNOWN [Stylonychia lemnae]